MSAMTTTAANGRTRRSLNDTITRLDDMIDGLSTAIPDTIRDTLEDAIGEAITAGVKAAVVEVLTNPDLRVAVGTPGEQPKVISLRERMAEAGRQASRTVARWVKAVGRTIGTVACAAASKVVTGIKMCGQIRRPLAIAIVVAAVAVGVTLVSPAWVGAVLSGLGGAAVAGGIQASLWFRRTCRIVLEG